MVRLGVRDLVVLMVAAVVCVCRSIAGVVSGVVKKSSIPILSSRPDVGWVALVGLRGGAGSVL